MPYELNFRARQSNRKITREQFKAYFAEKAIYELADDDEDPNLVEYLNPSTDASFAISFYDESEVRWATGTTEEEMLASRCFAYFQMADVRDSGHHLEAKREVHAFVQHFDLIVCDPADQWNVYVDSTSSQRKANQFICTL